MVHLFLFYLLHWLWVCNLAGLTLKIEKAWIMLGLVRLGLVRLVLVRLVLVRLILVRLGLLRLGLVWLGLVRLGLGGLLFYALLWDQANRSADHFVRLGTPFFSFGAIFQQRLFLWCFSIRQILLDNIKRNLQFFNKKSYFIF